MKSQICRCFHNEAIYIAGSDSFLKVPPAKLQTHCEETIEED